MGPTGPTGPNNITTTTTTNLTGFLKGNGSVISAATLAAADIPNLDTAKITSGTLAVDRGGTGATTHTSGNVLIGAGTGAITSLSRSGIDSRTDFPTTYANITGTVPTWNQNTTGNAATATFASAATDAEIAQFATTASSANTVDLAGNGDNVDFKIPFANHSGNTSGSYALLQDSQSGVFTYNPSFNRLTAGVFNGSGLTLSSTETVATNATITANSLTSGNALTISSTSTARTSSLLNIVSTGGSSSSSTPIGAKISVTNSHPGSNTALELTASGSANNTALNVTAGNTALQAVTATTFSGSGASLTSLNAGNISSGTLAVGRGGTGTGTAPSQGGIIYGSTTSAYASTSAGASRQVLLSNSTSAPFWGYLGGALTANVDVSTVSTT